jgi:predicted nucleic acid-binding protein
LRFWDSSALVPFIVRQRASARMRSLYRSDTGVVAWWSACVECESAVSRLEREGLLRRRSAGSARRRLDRFAAAWDEVQPSGLLRDHALRLLRVHDPRAADALQLAAAHAAAEGRPATLDFVCLDDRLAAAAEREGFSILSGSRRDKSRQREAQTRVHVAWANERTR